MARGPWTLPPRVTQTVDAPESTAATMLIREVLRVNALPMGTPEYSIALLVCRIPKASNSFLRPFPLAWNLAMARVFRKRGLPHWERTARRGG